MQMEIWLLLILCFYTTLSSEVSRNKSSNIFNKVPLYYDKSWPSATSGAKQQYQMLMDVERSNSELTRSSDDDKTYTDLYVIRCNDTDKVKNISGRCGFTFIRKVFDDEDYYLLRREKCSRFPRNSERFGHHQLRQDLQIQWTARQSLKNRVQRRMLDNNHDSDTNRIRLLLQNRFTFSDVVPISETLDDLNFNDPLFKEQWYLLNSGQTGTSPENDINVFPVWHSGITGKGTTISVLDDGIYRQSAEVADNYDAVSSDEYLFLKKDRKPVQENSHGTYCAAIAAGVANNGVCGVGVAYEAKVGGVRLLDGPLTDVQEALALVHALDHVDIYTASWGPTDDGADVDGPGSLARLAFIKGVTQGRNGKGSIYVWAAGNGGGYYDSCNLDGYASSPFTLTIGALTEDGRSTFYSEPCAAVIASAYVGGSFHTPPTSEKRKLDANKIKVVVPEGKGKCRETFQGTSAAAPMAAGVIALALQANPNLTWRDVQHIIIRSARVPDTDEDGWLVNAAGFAFHPKIGAGVLDSQALVQLARSWKTVGRLHVWKTPSRIGSKKTIPSDAESLTTLLIWKSDMDPQQRIDRLETVIATVNLQHLHCGDLEMVLESPSGTSSSILTRRPFDNKTTRLNYWGLSSIHFWGEDPEGLWTLRISNRNQATAGHIDYFSITLFGTEKGSTSY